jgi:hypothetical protein
MAIYYNNDARLLMDIKPNAVPFVGEDIVVPILTTMTAGDLDTVYNNNGKLAGRYTRPNTSSTAWTKQ